MILHQTLHGYQDGHRLLAASVELSRAEKHTLLTLSDMSGRSMVSGFEQYLTAYRVERFYAIAETWYAFEMDRPGCVWTHTLLIEPSDLRDLTLAGIRDAFQRPSVGETWDRYSKPLSRPAYSLDDRPVDPSQERVADATIRALYDDGKTAPVILLGSNFRALETLVFRVWRQQWLGLRSRFSICTGAIGHRTLDGSSFDLQVCPRSSAREIRREARNAIVIDPESIETQASTDWVRKAVNDLMSGDDSSKIRELIQTLPLETADRSLFKDLIELWTFVLRGSSGRTSATDLIAHLAHKYPSVSDGCAIKRVILGKQHSTLELFCGLTAEPDLLQALAFSDVGVAYSADELALLDRAQVLWNDDRTGAVRLLTLLLSRDHNCLGETVFDGLISQFQGDEVVQLSRDVPGLLTTLVRRKPEVAVSPWVWHQPAATQREIFTAATENAGLPDKTGEALIRAMLEAGSDQAAEQAIRRFGARTVEVVLDWLAEPSIATHLLPVAWQHSIRHFPQEAFSWLIRSNTQREGIFSLVARYLDPYDSAVRSEGAQVWLRGEDPDPLLADSDRIQYRAFTLCLGLSNAGDGAPVLVEQSFEPVYSALERDDLVYHRWIQLQRVVPSISWTRNWDKCERLRRGLALAIVEFDWPVTVLTTAARSPALLEQVLRSCRDVKGGNQLLKQLRNAANAGSIPNSSVIRNVLDE